jgi:hypothetical protein
MPALYLISHTSISFPSYAGFSCTIFCCLQCSPWRRGSSCTRSRFFAGCAHRRTCTPCLHDENGAQRRRCAHSRVRGKPCTEPRVQHLHPSSPPVAPFNPAAPLSPSLMLPAIKACINFCPFRLLLLLIQRSTWKPTKVSSTANRHFTYTMTMRI